MDIKTVRKAAASATGLHGAFSGKPEEPTTSQSGLMSEEAEDRKTQAILDRAVMAQRAAHQDDQRSSSTTRGGRGGRGGAVMIPRLPEEIREARSKTPTRNRSESRPIESSTVSSKSPTRDRSASRPVESSAMLLDGQRAAPPPKPPRPPPKPNRPFDYNSPSATETLTTNAVTTKPVVPVSKKTTHRGAVPPSSAPTTNPVLQPNASAELGRELLADAFVAGTTPGTLT
eukprot:CAMPEP_0171665596 /NCGR_PEP_ID=MMETSP0990-20121206/47564_1 /TAXON_ID=483369 /ORGANISM="non described non described, Strain CCMP2098" /LENGTH=229 /DNA_ID=CAMNT_0012248877 /DNA_START=12 /DNA_END=701 /DNA_ORIENTATION=+